MMSKELAAPIGDPSKHSYIGTAPMATLLRQSAGFHWNFVVLTLFLLLSSAFPQLTGNVVRASTPSYSVKAKRSAELRSLMKKLRGQGARVALTNERVKQPFFSVPARILNIDGVSVQVFQYSLLSAASKEAAVVNSDGMTIGTSKPSWMAPPHFFRSGRLIVLYVGNEQSILMLLQGALGNQFAGNE
jgi:hypothetical protein